jgi:hypothetical protein
MVVVTQLLDEKQVLDLTQERLDILEQVVYREIIGDKSFSQRLQKKLNAAHAQLSKG